MEPRSQSCHIVLLQQSATVAVALCWVAGGAEYNGGAEHPLTPASTA